MFAFSLLSAAAVNMKRAAVMADEGSWLGKVSINSSPLVRLQRRWPRDRDARVATAGCLLCARDAGRGARARSDADMVALAPRRRDGDSRCRENNDA